jgi:histidinol-phosphate aminotransferase
MEKFDLDSLVRSNISKMTAYASARSEFKGSAEVFLDANENSFGSPIIEEDYSRYPDPLQMQLKTAVAKIKNVDAENIFLGNGSDESIDLIIRAFCEPRIDNIIICPPTYGMYEVSANINDTIIKKIPLTKDFQLDLDSIAVGIDELTKIIFVCSPNNPTGNSLNYEDIEELLNNFSGIVVIDEAYINYSKQKSFIADLKNYPNLIIIQTFSKAWGLAALRLGMAFADTQIIEILNKIKPPYNVNGLTQQKALEALENIAWVNGHIKLAVAEREILVKQLVAFNAVLKIYPSDANFILVKFENSNAVFQYLLNEGIILRNRSTVVLCEDCLRITIGTKSENELLIEKLRLYFKQL